MLLYHGSNTTGLTRLIPEQADHDRPYVYLTTIEQVAALYLCNAVKRPYYWFPYGFENGSDVPNAYEFLQEYIREGKLKVSRFEDKSSEQLEWWYSTVVEYMKKKDMINTPDCSYARFVGEKLPRAWEKYMNSIIL